MNRLLEITSKLTPAELRQVEEFAQSLALNHDSPGRSNQPERKSIRFGSWAGCMAGIEPDKSDKELIREAWDEIVAKYDR